MSNFFFPARSLRGRFASLRTFPDGAGCRLPKPLISCSLLMMRRAISLAETIFLPAVREPRHGLLDHRARLRQGKLAADRRFSSADARALQPVAPSPWRPAPSSPWLPLKRNCRLRCGSLPPIAATSKLAPWSQVFVRCQNHRSQSGSADRARSQAGYSLPTLGQSSS